MTKGRIERYHRSIKNIIKLDNYCSQEEFERQIEAFGDYYNKRRYYASLNIITPADVFFGRQRMWNK